jgi:hypothetical protein
MEIRSDYGGNEGLEKDVPDVIICGGKLGRATYDYEETKKVLG